MQRAYTLSWLAGSCVCLLAGGACDFHIAGQYIARDASILGNHDAAHHDGLDSGMRDASTHGADDAGTEDAGQLLPDAGHVPGDAGHGAHDDGGGDPEDGGFHAFAFESKYFAHDQEALDVALGKTTAKLPATPIVDDLGLQWRLTNALRMLGYEIHGLMTGETIGSARMREIDHALAGKEAEFHKSALRLPDYRAIWAPDFESNIPQEFAVHQVASLFALLNTRGTLPPLERFSNECVLSNFLPGLCGSLVDLGTNMEGGSCQDPNAVLRDPQIVQMSDFLGFDNVRRQIAPNELPSVPPSLASNCEWVALFGRAFVAEIERSLGSYLDMQFSRAEACSDSNVDFYVMYTPFSFSGTPGTQISGDFVSVRASGFTNPSQVYDSSADVTETVTAYMLFPEYLRARAQRSTILQNKYDFVRNTMFGGVEFENPSLANVTFQFAAEVATFCWDNGLKQFRVEDIRPRP